MRKLLWRRIVLWNILPLLLVCLILLFLATQVVYGNALRGVELLAKSYCRETVQVLQSFSGLEGGPSAAWQQEAVQLLLQQQECCGGKVLLVNAQGAVLATTDAQTKENLDAYDFKDKDFWQALSEQGAYLKEDFSPFFGKRSVISLCPLPQQNGEAKLLLYLDIPIDMLYAQSRGTIYTLLALGTLMSLLLAALSAFLIAHYSVLPFQKTVQAAERIAQGDYKVRIPERVWGDELDVLQQTLRQMQRQLRQAALEWEESDVQMLEQVQKRTAELKLMTSDAEEARARAEETSRAKSEFLSDMSHDIRTQINTINGMTIIGQHSQKAEKKQYCLQKINDASSHLLSLVSNILDMSQIEAGGLELVEEPFHFEKMLRNSAAMFAERAQERNIALHMDVDPDIAAEMLGDELRLSQILTNLLSNAVKFTPIGGTVRLNARLEEQLSEEECLIYVEVIDSGIGISAERQEALFSASGQTEQFLERKYGGDGLGLVISQHIVELMGGQIGVDSELGKGSRFYFTVCLQYGKGVGEAVQSTHSMRVLVVDHTQEALYFFERVLSECNIDFDLTASGKDALKRLQQNMDAQTPYQLIFMDSKSGLKSSNPLAKKIRAVTGDSALLVLMTQEDTQELRQKAQEAGIWKVMQKPLRKSSILRSVQVAAAGRENVPQPIIQKDEQTYSRCRMLVADDIAIEREITAALLEVTGIQIDFAKNGQEAFEMITALEKPYDIVLMDIQMPVMDGLEAIRRIRAQEDETVKSIPIVVMTASTTRQEAEECIAAGATDSISKPIDADTLVRKVTACLEGKEDSF